MANFKFDGRILKERGKRVGELRGDNIYDSRGRRVGKINGNNIVDSRGSRVAQFDGRSIKDKVGRRIGTIDNVKEDIDGIGGASLVAMWLFFVR